MEYTPENINSLKPDEVFVFGSNLAGHHGGGAARAALNKFGAVWGQGVGLQGQSYAIPTMQGGVETIKPYVDEFIAFAKAHPELKFYVTRIGCGIAGFKDEEIAPLFQEQWGWRMSFFLSLLPNSSSQSSPSTSHHLRMQSTGLYRDFSYSTETRMWRETLTSSQKYTATAT